MPSPIIGRPVPDQVWESIRAEFTLPTLEQVRRRLAELMEDTDPVMQQLVRVFSSVRARTARASSSSPAARSTPPWHPCSGTPWN